MLTTEKLFRGDTEFALMEKVRKAEVPPPSNFNRRVTPELDAISLKALAREVSDRYQTAAQLANDLDALIAGYRFDPKELRQFMRQLFRKEYAKELEDSEMALAAQPGPARGAFGGDTFEMRTSTIPSGTGSGSIEPEDLAVYVTSGTPVPPSEEKPRSFWGSLFKRKK
jgi:eukaryotic-like serine/threonine-protein kinase